MRLAQVVSNLLTNAARYTPPGGRVVLRAHGVDGDRVRLAVSDTGIGMSPELRAQVFDLFFQGKRDIDRAEGGLGIGLALVKNIVGQHGGHVEAHSAGPGQGSEFVVLLPRRTPAACAVPDVAPPAAQLQLHPGARRRARHPGRPRRGVRRRGQRLARQGMAVPPPRAGHPHQPLSTADHHCEEAGT